MNLHVRAPIFSCSGYARVRHLIKELHILGVNIQLTPFNVYDRVNFNHEQLFKTLSKPIDSKINLSVGIPFQFLKKPNMYNIGYTMFEASSIPKLWVDCCNDMDEIWVPTEKNKTTFRLCGVKTPIFVVPYGVDDNLFQHSKSNHSNFVFLAVGTYIDRKGWNVLFSSFISAFKDNKKVKLICKFDKTNPYIDKKNVDNIIVIDEKLDDTDMVNLYQAANCFVLPTRGEGFCLPALEAITCGIPVIITKDSGYGDFLNNNNAWFIKSKGLYPASPKLCSINPVYYNTWFQEPDEQHLTELLCYVVDNKKEYQKKCSVKIDEKFYYRNIAVEVYNRLKYIYETKN